MPYINLIDIHQHITKCPLITTHILNCYMLQPNGHFPGHPYKHSICSTQRFTTFIALIIPILVKVYRNAGYL